MQTVTGNLEQMAAEIRDLLEKLLLNHSSIYLWNTPGGPVLFISADGNYSYRDLDESGRRVQARLLEEYRRYQVFLEVLLKDLPRDSLEQLSECSTVVSRTIEQEDTWCKNTQEALDKATEALQCQLRLLGQLYDPSEGEVAYVPDTNALLYNPRLEKWVFEETPRFTMILVPTVLSELDALKINHRNENIRERAELLIRKIKEYRRRGMLTAGIPAVKDKIDILAVATEPDIRQSLPWLDPGNNDDRFLAAVIEIMRARPRSAVALVSRDINLQNKAEFARLPFVEPPEPV